MAAIKWPAAPTTYEDDVVLAFTIAAVLWSLIGMAAGVYAAAELVWPALNLDFAPLTFGRLRTVHTNAVLFGFAVSALMGTSFYTVQRTCHIRIFAPNLAWTVFFAWQLIVIAGAVSLFMGANAGKEYAELEWPIDIAITVVWVIYGVVFFGTIAIRRIEQIYISNWFFGAFILVVAMLHIVNSLAIPVSAF